MSKRIHYIYAVLSIVLLSLTLQTFTPVLGLNAIETDPENDVYRVHMTESSQDIKKGDYHDEIDIVKLEINGQTVNLTFAGNIADWQFNDTVETRAIIVLHEDFTSLEDMTYPYYAILYDNWTYYELGYRLFLTYETEFDSEYWNGSGWASSEDLAVDVGFASDKSIVANVPSGAFIIPDDITFLAQAMCAEFIVMFIEMIVYTDIAPNKYDPLASSADQIPSYNLFIVVGVLVGISLIIIKKQIGKK